MKFKQIRFSGAFLVLIIGWMFFSATCNARETIGFGYKENPNSNSLSINVIDEFTGLPLLDAEINQNSKYVSVKRNGYTDVIIFGLNNGDLTVYLKPTASFGAQAEYSGQLTDYLPQVSGSVDGGLVLRSLGVSDLLALNPDTLMSPLKDTIQALGSRDIPSNLVFPDQRIAGGLLRLNKPTYRLPMSTMRTSRLVSLEASIQTSSLLGLPSKPRAADFVNLLNARKMGFTEEFTPTGSANKNIALTTAIDQKCTLSVPAADFPSDLFGLNTIDLKSDSQSFMPTDVKALKVGTYDETKSSLISLLAPSKLPSGSSMKVVAAALSENGTTISVSILPFSQSVKAPPFLKSEHLKDGPIPSQMTLKSGNLQIVNLSLFEKTDATGVYGKQIFILPNAKEVTLNLKEFTADLKVSRISLERLEFNSAFNPNDFEAGEVVNKLSQFTFSGMNVL